jgi:hypothetical protein
MLHVKTKLLTLINPSAEEKYEMQYHHKSATDQILLTLTIDRSNDQAKKY